MLSDPRIHSGKKGDLFIFTQPRSGLTWLSELLALRPHTRVLKEALNFWNNTLIQNYLPPRGNYINLNTKEEAAFYQCLNHLLAGKHRGFTKNFLKKEFHRYTNLNIMVLSNANAMAQRILCQNPANKALVLIRNPYTNCLSKYRNNWHMGAYQYYKETGWEAMLDAFIEATDYTKTYLNNERIQLIKHYRYKSGADLERYALNWCLETLPLLDLVLAQPERVFLLFYEDLVLDTKELIRKISEFTGYQFPFKAEQKQKASASSFLSESVATQKIEDGQAHHLLNTWRNKIEATSQKNLQAIFKAFGLSEMVNEVTAKGGK